MCAGYDLTRSPWRNDRTYGEKVSVLSSSTEQMLERQTWRESFSQREIGAREGATGWLMGD